MTLDSALLWTQSLIALAVFLQTLEFFQIRKSFSDQGVWQWKILRLDYRSPLGARILDWILAERSFVLLLIVRFVSALLCLLIVHWILFALLFLSTYFISLRWRGAFNGGSDSMTILISLVLLVASLSPEQPFIQTGCMLYLALQTCLSYLLPGIAKLKKIEWRDGRALEILLKANHYGIYNPLPHMQRHPLFLKIATWMILAFEILFPLALLSPKFAGAFILLALGFHLANTWIFGLNRFFFAWISAYPALIYASFYFKLIF